MDGFLVAMDIEKAFDSLDHDFLILTLEKYGFGKNVILWVKILLRDQEPCVFYDGTTTKNFPLKRGARQGDPISAFLFKTFIFFYVALEILFILIKSKPEIEGMTVSIITTFVLHMLMIQPFFLKNIISVKHMVDILHFFYFS